MSGGDKEKAAARSKRNRQAKAAIKHEKAVKTYERAKSKGKKVSKPKTPKILKGVGKKARGKLIATHRKNKSIDTRRKKVAANAKRATP